MEASTARDTLSDSIAEDFDSNAIEKFRQYLRINTTTKHANYAAVVSFLERYSAELDCQFKVVYMVSGKPICILTFPGTSLARETVMLNSHSDVVAAEASVWSHAPFAAEMDCSGNIYGRGAQDTKQIGIQYLEALRKLRRDHITLKRTVAVTFVPDEEIGGYDGMCKFVESESFRSMNVVICLDEGIASQSATIGLYDRQKYRMPFRFVINSTAQHSSLLPLNTAGDKLTCLLEEIYNFREQQRRRIGTVANDQITDLHDVIAVNLTTIEGGTSDNALPSRIECVVDCRVPSTVLPAEVHELMHSFANTATKRCSTPHDHDLLPENENISVFSLREDEFASSSKHSAEVHLPHDSKYRTLLDNACKQFGVPSMWGSLIGQSDARFLRRKGIAAVNVSPLYEVPVRAHQVDEHLHRDLFCKGITFYYFVIQQLANSD